MADITLINQHHHARQDIKITELCILSDANINTVCPFNVIIFNFCLFYVFLIDGKFHFVKKICMYSGLSL